MIEPEDLKEVMMMMKDEYDLIRAYFQKGAASKNTDKAAAVKAAERLGKYAELIADFEPPKNPNNTEEYTPTLSNSSERLSKNSPKLSKQKVPPRKLKSNGRVSSI